MFRARGGGSRQRDAAEGRPRPGAADALGGETSDGGQSAGALPDSGLIDKIDSDALLRRSVLPRRARLRNFVRARRPEPEPSYVGVVEEPFPGKVGLCCSGGGIRSAAFNLGALQTMQEVGLLQKARYLAAVSGGSYIAAAFAMVNKRWRKEATPRAHEPPKRDPENLDSGWDDSDPLLVDSDHPPFHPGSPEEQYLRNRSSYMAPGALGKLRLGYRVLVGATANLGLIALALLVAGTVLGLAYGWVLHDELRNPLCVGSRADDCRFNADTTAEAWTALGIAGTGLSVGLVAVLFRGRQAWDRPGVLEAWSLRIVGLGAGVGLVLALVPEVLEALREAGRTADPVKEKGAVPRAVGGAGFISVALAALAHLTGRVSTPPEALKHLTRGRRALKALSRRSQLALAYLVGAVIGPLLLAAFLVWVMLSLLEGAFPPLLLIAAPVLLLGVYRAADLTSWSLHPFYKRRLCSAFALKRVRREGRDYAEERDYNSLVPLWQTGVDTDPSDPWPTLLVCAAANISDPGATPPGRGVTSFTFSAYTVGGPLTGARTTREFWDSIDDRRRRDFTLPAAVAMSGAAISPSMGKSTRRPFTFLMALTNLRLGVWMPNPRWTGRWRRHQPVTRLHPFDPAKRQAAKQESNERKREKQQQRGVGEVRKIFPPRPRPRYLLNELLGINRVNDEFLYVTDGGHYENLGLVELLRRGCTDVYCFDASGGESFQALGDAIALARSELGVEISIDPTPLNPRGEEELAEANHVEGTIRYTREGVSGRLIYARSVLTADAPWDVLAYHREDPRFPHHSTVDQLYTDQRFEAYRALGACAARRALETTGAAPPSPPEDPWAKRLPALRANAANGAQPAAAAGRPGEALETR